MHVQRENPEWVNYWWDIADDKSVKRWLLVGDSVARQLRGIVQSIAPERVSVDFLGMSFSLLDEGFMREIKHIVSYKEYAYDLLLLNCGFHHGFGTRVSNNNSTYQIYENRLGQITDFLSEKCAEIVLISGTPEVKSGDLNTFNEDINTEIEARNRIFKNLSLRKKYKYIDLYELVMKNRTRFSYVDRFHFERIAVYPLANEIMNNIYGIKYKNDKKIISGVGQRISNARIFEFFLKEKPIVLYGIGKNARRLYKYINARGGKIQFAVVSDGQATDCDYLSKVLVYSDVDFKQVDCTLLVTVKNSYDIEKQLSHDAVPYIMIDDSLLDFIIKYNEAFLYDSSKIID